MHQRKGLQAHIEYTLRMFKITIRMVSLHCSLYFLSNKDEFTLFYFFYSRPTNFHKNQIAASLVKTYPILAASNCDVPQVNTALVLAAYQHFHAYIYFRHFGSMHMLAE